MWIFLYIIQKKNVETNKMEEKMEESMQKIREKVENSIMHHGITVQETMKWSILLNKLIDIYYKMKEYDLNI